MKVKYLQLHAALNIPGPGTSARWAATGQDGEHKGTVKHIARVKGGYVMELAKLRGSTGHHAGFYYVQDNTVAFAFCEYSPEERAQMGFDLSEAETIAIETSKPQTRKAKTSTSE